MPTMETVLGPSLSVHLPSERLRVRLDLEEWSNQKWWRDMYRSDLKVRWQPVALQDICLPVLVDSLTSAKKP